MTTITETSDGTTFGTSGTAYWTCSVCGQRVPYGNLHLCGERAEIGPGAAVWELSPNVWSSVVGEDAACGSVANNDDGRQR